MGDDEMYLVHFQCELESEGEFWIAISDSFGFAGSGQSTAEAIETLRSSIQGYIRAMKRRGKLEEALAAKGITWENFSLASGGVGVQLTEVV